MMGHQLGEQAALFYEFSLRAEQVVSDRVNLPKSMTPVSASLLGG
jgi:hypothetical protein